MLTNDVVNFEQLAPGHMAIMLPWPYTVKTAFSKVHKIKQADLISDLKQLGISSILAFF